MKPLFRCDYCDFTGTELEVKKHEPQCIFNYDRRSCYTCQYKGILNLKQYKCAQGREIPESHIIEFCPQYRRKTELSGNATDILDSLFGGI